VERSHELLGAAESNATELAIDDDAIEVGRERGNEGGGVVNAAVGQNEEAFEHAGVAPAALFAE
jgi:hypothetical protein